MEKNFRIDAEIKYDSQIDKFSRFILTSPLSICFQVINRCNFNCPHCISNSGPDMGEGLRLSEIKKILGNLAKIGVRRVDITGGEPYLRKDINEILLFSNKVGLDTVVTSNGSLLNESHINALKKSKALIQISLDGPDEINSKIRQPGSYSLAIKAIKLLVKNKIPVRINCTLQKKNYKYVDYMYSLTNRLKVSSLYFIVVSAQGRGKALQNKICLSLNQEKLIRKKVKEFSLNKKIDIKILDYKLFETACVLIDNKANFVSQRFDQDKTKIIGNVLKEDIKKMWQDPKAFDHTLHLLQYLQHPALIK